MFIYLASPYSHKDKKIVLDRFDKTEATVAFFFERGITIYSPIVHCHEIATKFRLPTDAEFWQRHNHRMLGSSQQLWVLKLDGWEASLGVKDELTYAITHHKPVSWIEPDQLSRYV